MNLLRWASWRSMQSLLALAVMIVVLGVSTDSFLSLANGWNILRQISVNLCLSIGMTLVVITGGIDLSVGAILALAGAVAAGLLRNGLGLPWQGAPIAINVLEAILVAIAVGSMAGFCNGAVVAWMRLPAFVATLAMLSIARGLTMLWTGGYPITGLGGQFGAIGTGHWVGVPMPVWEVLALVLLAIFLTRRTAFGRHLYAVGGSERAARLAGLRVNAIKVWVYTLGGALAGVAGLIVTARLDSAQPNAGLGYELDSIAAVVIGGTSLSGGRGSIGGTVLGCLIIGVLNNGLFLLDVSPFWQQVIKGVVILAAVSLDRMGQGRSAAHAP
jgi:ribose transport system permease protein